MQARDGAKGHVLNWSVDGGVKSRTRRPLFSDNSLGQAGVDLKLWPESSQW